MSTFTTTNATVRFTDTDGAVSFTATRPAVTFTAAYQSVTGGGDPTAAIAAHNVSTTAHTDLRDLASGTGVRAVVNAPSTVATHAQLIDSGGIDLQIWPDGSACGFFTRAGTTYMVAPGGDVGTGDGVTLTEVVADNPTVNRGPNVAITSGPSGTTWLGAGGGVHDTGTDLYLITHVEEEVNGFGWWYIGMSKSTDNGATWVYQYDIVTPLLTKATLAQEAPLGNGALIEHEGYLYLFHQAILADGSTVQFAAARATVASVEADTNEWATWTGTAWVDGGVPAELMPDSVTTLHPSGFDVVEVGTDGHGLLFTDGNAGSWFLYSPDLLRWDLHEPQLVHPANNTEELYRTFWSGDADHPKRLTDTGILFVVSSASGGFDRWDDNKLVAYDLRRFSLVQDLDRKLSEFQTARTYISPHPTDLGEVTPGTLITSEADQTFTMPAAASLATGDYRFTQWTIYDPFGGCTITTDPGDAIPINAVGDLTLAAGDVATMIPLDAVPMWVGYITPGVGGATLAALGGGSGDVVGPASVTADRPAVFDGTTGKLIKQGSATGAALVAAADAAAARTALGLGTAATSASGDFQPADSDLTSIAALTTTSYGRAFLELANAAAARTAIGVGRHWKKAPPASSYDTGFSGMYGMPPWDVAGGVAAEAYAAGTMVMGWCDVTGPIATVTFEVSATSLSSGQSVTLVCYALDSNGKPTGSPLWTETKVVGTSTGVYTISLTRDLGTEGRVLGLLNPSGNAGSVTIYNFQPTGPYHAATRGIAVRPALNVASMASPPDLTNYKYNNATGASQMAFNQRMPLLFLKT